MTIDLTPTQMLALVRALQNAPTRVVFRAYVPDPARSIELNLPIHKPTKTPEMIHMAEWLEEAVR